MNLEVDEICFKSIQLQELHSSEESFQTEIEYVSHGHTQKLKLTIKEYSISTLEL